MSYEEVFEIYRAALGAAGVELKGKNNPYSSANGYMTTFLGKDGTLGVRLSKEELKEFFEKYDTTHQKQYGANMKDFAKVPENFFADQNLFVKIIKHILAHTNSLPPK